MADSTTPQGAQGGASTTVEASAGGTTAPAAPATTNGGQGTPPRATNSGIDRMIARYGDERKVIRVLLNENHDLREFKRTATLVPAGGVGLSKADADAWAAFKALGKDPAALRTVLTEHATMSAEQQERTTRASVDGLARTAGYNVNLLHRVAKADGVRLESRTVAVRGEDGRTTQQDVLHVITGEGDAAKAVPLDEYRKAHWDDFIPEPTPRDPDEDEGTPRSAVGTATEAPERRPMPPMSTGTTPRKPATTEQAVRSHLMSRYPAPKAAT